MFSEFSPRVDMLISDDYLLESFSVCFSFYGSLSTYLPGSEAGETWFFGQLCSPHLWHKAGLRRRAASRDVQKSYLQAPEWPSPYFFQGHTSPRPSPWASICFWLSKRSGKCRVFLHIIHGLGINEWARSHTVIMSLMAADKVVSQWQQQWGVPGIQGKLEPLTLVYCWAHGHWRVDEEEVPVCPENSRSTSSAFQMYPEHTIACVMLMCVHVCAGACTHVFGG